jgi:hypothetical protein
MEWTINVLSSKESHTSLVSIGGCALAEGALVKSVHLSDVELDSQREEGSNADVVGIICSQHDWVWA